ncbi:Hypp1054 [Branchiostoma lanceolatum]|uniref:phytol kinase n=1 Tax=Branchiostoma lanceolatum TaxID=7740 RepID=A0A8J9ZGQ0_BRALA|nr:Hypp1054 [Branchiostoma lanceolatum]
MATVNKDSSILPLLMGMSDLDYKRTLEREVEDMKPDDRGRQRLKKIPSDPEDCVSMLVNNFHIAPTTWRALEKETQSQILMRLGERGMIRLVSTAIMQKKILLEMMPSSYAGDSITKSRLYLHDTVRTITTMSTYLPAAKKLGQFFKHLLPSFEDILGDASKQLWETREVDVEQIDYALRGLHNIIVSARRKEVLQPFCKSKCYEYVLDILHTIHPTVLYYALRIVYYTVEMGTDKERERFKEEAGIKLLEENMKLLRIDTDKRGVKNLLLLAGWLKDEVADPGSTPEYFRICPKIKRLINDGPQVEEGIMLHTGVVPVICSRLECRKTEAVGEVAGKPLKACARCLLARYCSVECQKLHWKNGHKEECFTKEDLLKNV